MILKIVKIASLLIALFIGASSISYFVITLFVKSESTVIVPNLSGKSLSDTLKTLSALDLNTKLKNFEYHNSINIDHVIYQDPKPGIEIKKGRNVNIIVSKGSRTVTIPNLQGLPIERAKIILEENGLCIGAISLTESISIKKDLLIAQFPEGPEIIERGRCVDLLVSSGPPVPAYMMDRLTGFSLNQAINLIEKKGLAIEKLKSFYIETLPEYTVLNQHPPYGYRVVKNGSIDLVVNKKPGAGSSIIAGSFSKIGLLKYRVSSGFLKRHVRVQLKTIDNSEERFEGFLEPSKDFLILINKSEKVLIYEDDRLMQIGRKTF